MTPIFCCAPDNDLFLAYTAAGGRADRIPDPDRAIDAAPNGAAVFVLADDYPAKRTALSSADFAAAQAKELRLYLEYPAQLPGLTLGESRTATWERIAAVDDTFLPERSILAAHACVYLPAQVDHPLLAIGRMAGYDTAEFGIPESAQPILFEFGGALVATTKLSGFRTGRYAPTASWSALWNGILSRLVPELPVVLSWQPVVTPTLAPDDPVDATAERAALDRVVNWHLRADVLINDNAEQVARELIPLPTEAAARDRLPLERGNGRHGILEGYESQIQPDGSQYARIALRADCLAEAAMVFAAADREVDIAANLLDYLYGDSGLCRGDRADPNHPAYGHIGWGSGSQPWETANYGDDNARVILASLLVSAQAGSQRWLEAIVRAVLANLRTTGRRGFRGDRIDMPELTEHGWRYFHDRENVNLSPHFECYLWACYLWAYEVTGRREYLDCARTGLATMMAAFPTGWRRNDVTERARMLLPLSWLVRIEGTEEHRRWLSDVAEDLVRDQQSNGAIPERELGGPGHFQASRANEEYGLSESPLIQHTGDPASDQLYTTGFALIGLHEAAAATGDARLTELADRLAGYLVRIQTTSTQPRLDGTWLRAFDYRRWDYWSSSGDLGWGAWCIEVGWGQSWIALALALRQSGASLWDRVTSVRPAPELADRLWSQMLGPRDR